MVCEINRVNEFIKSERGASYELCMGLVLRTLDMECLISLYVGGLGAALLTHKFACRAEELWVDISINPL